MKAPGYFGLNVSFPQYFVVRVVGRQEALCVNYLVATFLQLFLFVKAKLHSSPNIFREMAKAHNGSFPIFHKTMFQILCTNDVIKTRITNLSENISRDLKDIFTSLGTGKTSWYQKEMISVISR